jgi:hypothetical protein
MELSKRAFSIKYNFETQWLSSLCNWVFIPFKKKGIRKIFIEEQSINSLQKGVHYVECPKCFKKMSCITQKHLCNIGAKFERLYCEIYLKNHKKTEEQKIKQSDSLKERFQTNEGAITRKQIGEASKRLNADPEFKVKKIIKSQEVQNRPENKKLRSKKSLAMWADPVFK